ncbi:excinuclease ABC subunit UvrC [Candidatus Saccharibacteria bacterium]|nr:excinuclease ABC subunit UvrC [Candidatus Saccharibacteria bacterium]
MKMNVSDVLQKKLKELPGRPGVYFHKDATGEVIYVGKAANLKNRVRSYFRKQEGMDVKTRVLVGEIATVDWVEVETEVDALFLEGEMVKRYMPRWNILLRDDKSCTYVRIGMKDVVPTVTLTRNPLDDGASYFGPYLGSGPIRKALRYLRRVYPFYEKPFKDGKLDLNYHMGLTPGLETGKMTEGEYRESLRKLVRYIKGERVALVKELEREMRELAEKLEYEKAAAVRKQWMSMKALQTQVVFGDREFLDISKDRALVELKELFGLAEIPVRIEGYDVSHMGGANVVGAMVVFKNGVSSRADYRKFKVGGGNDDVGNMREVLKRRFAVRNEKWGKPDLVLVDGGKGQLGAAVEVMRELEVDVSVVGVMKRADELVVCDGSGVRLSMEGVRDGRFTVVNLHGGKKRDGHGKNLVGMSGSYADVVGLVQRVRDEAHRFAVSYHTLLRKKRQVGSALDGIDGVGPKTRAVLKRRVGSVEKIRAASEEELAGIIGKDKARRVKEAVGESDAGA